jgi:hypothetical protein
MGKINPQHKITSWVAVVIIASIGSFFVYMIWANANESWAYEYVYPQFNKRITKIITKVSTIGWKTHRDEGYGFELKHPAKYSGTIDIIAQNSILGTSASPVPGASIGPLIFIKADTSSLKNKADTKFNTFWNKKGKNESPTDYCDKGVVQNTSLDIRVASCLSNGKKANYALIQGNTFDMFVDGSTSGFDEKLISTYGLAGNAVSKEEFVQILSTFKFITPTN